MMSQSELEAEVTRLEDIEQIQNLQGRYQHYHMMHDFDYIMDNLIAQKDPKVSVEINDSGVFVGLEKVRQVFMMLKEMTQTYQGIMDNKMAISPVIEVNKDGKTAKGMWFGFGPATLPGTAYPCEPEMINQLIAIWSMGKYDMEYVKEDGKWKIRRLCFICIFNTPYEQGWIKQPVAHSFANCQTSKLEPDKPPTYYMPYHIDRFNEFLPAPPKPAK